MCSAILYLNGALSAREISKTHDAKFDYVVAADGGMANAIKAGRTPHIVVGDLDSIPKQSQSQLPDTKFVRRPSQEMNDLEKALQYCAGLQVSRLTLAGTCGKRLDHTINNLSVISRYADQFSFTIFDEFSRIWIARKEWTFSGAIDQLVSLIPVGEVEGITTHGLNWELSDESLVFGQREGLSNYIVSNPVAINIRNGTLLIFVVDTE